jgi:hypothetical protein
LDVDPNFHQGHVNVALACWKMMDYEQAMASATKALSFEPTS